MVYISDADVTVTQLSNIGILRNEFSEKKGDSLIDISDFKKNKLFIKFLCDEVMSAREKIKKENLSKDQVLSEIYKKTPLLFRQPFTDDWEEYTVPESVNDLICDIEDCDFKIK